jgi:Protein of unknown function (DUF3489)
METVMSKIPTTIAKLSDTQLVILSAAAQRTNRSLIPFPKGLTSKGTALSKVVETLCKRNLAEERTSDGSFGWRRDKDGASIGLFITTNGLLALGLDGAEKSELQPADASTTPKCKTAPAKRPAAPVQTKQVVVIEMLRRKPGASIQDIIAKTKWQPHSVRGFFSGIVRKKLKLPLVSDVGEDGLRRYHIAPIASSKS